MVQLPCDLENVLQVIFAIRRVLKLLYHRLRVIIVYLLTREDHHCSELTEEFEQLPIGQPVLLLPDLPLSNRILK